MAHGKNYKATVGLREEKIKTSLVWGTCDRMQFVQWHPIIASDSRKVCIKIVSCR